MKPLSDTAKAAIAASNKRWIEQQQRLAEEFPYQLVIGWRSSKFNGKTWHKYIEEWAELIMPGDYNIDYEVDGTTFLRVRSEELLMLAQLKFGGHNAWREP